MRASSILVLVAFLVACSAGPGYATSRDTAAEGDVHPPPAGAGASQAPNDPAPMISVGQNAAPTDPDENACTELATCCANLGWPTGGADVCQQLEFDGNDEACSAFIDAYCAENDGTSL